MYFAKLADGASGPRSKARANGSVYNSTRSAPIVLAQRIAAGSGSTNRLTRTPAAFNEPMMPASVSAGVSAGHPASLVISPGFTGTSVH